MPEELQNKINLYMVVVMDFLFPKFWTERKRSTSNQITPMSAYQRIHIPLQPSQPALSKARKPYQKFMDGADCFGKYVFGAITGGTAFYAMSAT